MTIDSIREMISNGKIKWTTHCIEKMGERDISIADIEYCVANGEIIENYPDDYPHPSCLIYCKMEDSRVLHVVVGSNGDTAFIITAYIPNALKFEADLKTRRN